MAELGGPSTRSVLGKPCPRAMMPAQPPAKGKRASLLTWNCGGLTSEIYNDFISWLMVKQIDIAVLQSTRWKGERTWCSHGYSIIQDGEPEGTCHTYAGLMIFISNRVCNIDDISYASIVPGRLMHIRCRLQSNSLDLINLYQYPDSPTASRPNPIEARGDIWTKLDSLLHKLARRNLAVVAGDFNCPINAKASKQQSLPADHYELKELIRKYQHSSEPKAVRA